MSKTPSILIIEDDKYTRLYLKEILNNLAIISEATEIEEAKNALKINDYDIVITDIELGNNSGIELIPSIVKKGIHCIVISSHENEEIIEIAYTLGAKHFLSKSQLGTQLPNYIQKILSQNSTRLENFFESQFITQDSCLIYELKTLVSLELRNKSIFIYGPSGTGKSLIGKLIHEIAGNKGKIVHINCSEIPESLIESELFGHEKGAFTGAERKKEGKLKLADGGTLFLDEVGTMPTSMQQKLLKALDEKTFYPIGSDTPVKSNFTLVTATCEDIQEKIEAKTFREDLYYRISGLQFYIPPLKERVADIELLVKDFQKKCPRRFVIRTEAMDIIRSHSWPGNVRELTKVCEYLSQTSSGIVDQGQVRKAIGQSTKSEMKQETWDEHVLNHGLRSLIEHIEKTSIQNSLKRNNGKITNCIKELKISSSAFYRILNDHQLNF